jgi:type II secretory pathway component PulM
MKLDAKAADQVVKAIQDEVQIVTHTLREKGSKRFERPLLLGAVLIVASYYLLYLPPQRKLDALQNRIDTAKALSTNADAFKLQRDNLRAIYAALPKTKDKDHFLIEAVVETLRAEGLTSDSIQPPDENKESNLIYQQIKVSAQMKFPELVGWLARVEASKPFLHIASVDLVKSKHLGYCEVQAGVATIIPEKDLTR